VLVLAKNFAQTPSDTVANDSSADASGRNETGAGNGTRLSVFQKAERKHFAANRPAFGANPAKFRIQS
jgi:hypothetical protein